MKLVHQDFSRPIFEEKDNFVELIIESPECLGAYISELAEQCKGQEGRYVLSDKEKEVDLAKNVEIIFDRNLLGGLYRENPVKSRNYEAVKSSKKWENVGNSYIIPALLLYRYSYI